MAISSLILGLIGAAAATGDRVCPMTGIQQLRIYEIFDSNKAAFHDRFRDHAKRIMDRHQFDIVAMWETRQGDRTEFVYLLQWPDEATMKARWSEFMADEEWSGIKRETGAKYGDLVGEIEDRTLRKTAYSPC
jgi:hypothetical protein